MGNGNLRLTEQTNGTFSPTIIRNSPVGIGILKGLQYFIIWNRQARMHFELINKIDLRASQSNKFFCYTLNSSLMFPYNVLIQYPSYENNVIWNDDRARYSAYGGGNNRWEYMPNLVTTISGAGFCRTALYAVEDMDWVVIWWCMLWCTTTRYFAISRMGANDDSHRRSSTIMCFLVSEDWFIG